jgi:EF-P beta-lysylation protein EpmB
MEISLLNRPSLQDIQVDWQTAMKRAIRSTSELRRRLGLPEALGSDSVASAEDSFATFVPLEFLRKMQPGDDRDPLLLQVLASPNESIEHVGFVADPVGDLASLADHGVLHKYDGRALIVTTGACAVHCRYCFRREFPYHDAGARPGNRHHAMQYIASHPEIEEVLLSGGDPLTIADASLFQLIEGLESISHVRRLRIHTRMPIVIPQRLTDTLIQRLSQSRLACWLVVHANHPRELCDAVLERLECVVDHGIPVLNQSVLLRDINDNVETLVELSRVLINHRLQPYYLHQLDPVRGAAHFEVPMERGRELVAEMRSRLPGYAVPMYVAEYAGHSSKTPLEIASHHGCE